MKRRPAAADPDNYPDELKYLADQVPWSTARGQRARRKPKPKEITPQPQLLSARTGRIRQRLKNRSRATVLIRLSAGEEHVCIWLPNERGDDGIPTGNPRRARKAAARRDASGTDDAR